MFVLYRTAGGREVFGALVAEVVFAGFEIVSVGGGFDAGWVDGDKILVCVDC
jgi:hypothetical protein